MREILNNFQLFFWTNLPIMIYTNYTITNYLISKYEVKICLLADHEN